MMRRILLTYLLVLSLVAPAWAASTVDPNVPAANSNLTSAPVRGNFAAANTDINNLLTQFAGPNAPVNPSVGQFWRKTNVSPQIISQWSGSAWLPYSTFDIANGRVTPIFGNSLLAWQQLLTGTGGLGVSGQCITSTGPTTVPTAQNCVSAGTVNATLPIVWNPSTLNISLNYGANFTVSGSNLILADVITAASNVGSSSVVPVITFNSKGQLTTVTTATITPASIGAVPTTRAVTAGIGLSGGCVDLSTNCSFTLATVIAGGSSGDSTHVPAVTYNVYGQITGVTSTLITPAASSVTGQFALSQFPNIANNTVIGNVAGSTTTPIALSSTQLTTLCNIFTSSLSGCVPSPGSPTGRLLSDNGTWISVAGTGTVTSVSVTPGVGITQSGSPVTGSGSITVNVDKASSSDVQSGTSNKVLTSDNVFTAEVPITWSTATQTLDFNTFLSARVTMSASVTSLTCTNMKPMQGGVITFVQDATGSRTVPTAWCSQFRWNRGVRGVLSTAANTIDAMPYYCVSSSICYVSLGNAEAN